MWLFFKSHQMYQCIAPKMHNSKCSKYALYAESTVFSYDVCGNKWTTWKSSINTQSLESKLSIIFALNKSLKYISRSIRLSRNLKYLKVWLNMKSSHRYIVLVWIKIHFFSELNISQRCFPLSSSYANKILWEFPS